MLGWLVGNDIFEEANVFFLVQVCITAILVPDQLKGHTHTDIDQFFGTIKEQMKYKDLEWPRDLDNLLSELKHRPCAARIPHLWDFKAWSRNCAGKLTGMLCTV
jgi:hypothetical protein